MITETEWDVDNIILLQGRHRPPNGKVEACAMEALYLRWAMRQGWSKRMIVAGWTDRLDCVDLYIGAFVRSWNDTISNDVERTEIFTAKLLDLLPGTKGDEALILRRMWMGIDWDIRVRMVALLRLAKLSIIADKVAALSEIDSLAKLNDAQATIQEAQRDAAAARAAASDPVRDAAMHAAMDAAGHAVWQAAWAVSWDIVGHAAGTAARYAAWDAADAAADATGGDVLRPAVAALQASGINLIRHMCALK